MRKTILTMGTCALLAASAPSASADAPPPDVCGDGWVSGGEACDDGYMNGQPYYCNAACTGYTVWCGDWYVDGAEVCDDGYMNGQPGHCNGDCTGFTAATCGDGWVSAGEVCDDGYMNGQPYYCNAACDGYTVWCGDWYVDGAEVCDDGYMNGQPGHCNGDCTGFTAATCGDGWVSAGEVCDDGYMNGQPYYCDADCAGYTVWCGDGVVGPGEACDDGYLNGQPGRCDATCTSAPARAPFTSADKAPVIQALSYGHVLGTRDYEVTFSLGELPGVGLAPGFGVSIRLRSNGEAGECGPACEILLASGDAGGSTYVVREAGGAERRFELSGASYVELPPRPGVPFRPATGTLTAAGFVLTEVSGALTRTFNAAGREVLRATPWGSLTLSYDAQGRLTGAANAAGASLSVAYDAAGRLASVTDPTGFQTTLVYTPNGHLASIQGPADGYVTPNMGFVWSGDDIVSVGRLGFNTLQLVYDDGLVVTAADMDGTAYAFRSGEDHIEIIDSSRAYRRMDYDGETLVSTELGDGTKVTYQHDSLGRVTEVRHATGAGDLVQSFTYDAANNVIAVNDPEGHTSTFTYDASGNVLTSTDSEGHTTTFGYDGDRLVAVTDPLGRTSTTTYDANGLPLSTTALGVTTSVTYDARGQVVTSTDPFGVTTTFGYDAHGRLVSQSRPGSPPVTITRAPAGSGEQVTITRGAESSTTVMDRYGRVTSASSTRGPSLAYTYDPITGLPSGTTQSFRGKTQTATQTYTGTGDSAQVWINGQPRQTAARVVPPGAAWFEP